MRKLMRRFSGIVLIGMISTLAMAEVGQDGLHKEDWFALTFKDIAEDIADAADENKRLVLIFEQEGCAYCRKMHEVLLADPEVRDYIKENFNVVQMNMFGDVEVTDLDGEKLTEKTAVGKWGVFFTPNVLFMPENAPAGMDAGRAAVAVMPGLFSKRMFLNMFKWVREKGYEGEEHFQKYHARVLQELKSTGKLTD